MGRICSNEHTDGLFISLAVYFFLTLFIGCIGAIFLCARKYVASSHGGEFESGADDGDDIFERMAESWQISFRELKFIRRIGVGNVGEVYLGTYRGRFVAIKKLLGTWYKDDEMIERFKEEILLMSTMNHQNVLMFVGAVLDRDAGNICLVTEYCERGTLFDVLHSDEPLSWPKRLKMARDIALGMDYLHNKAGIIQRDLKSQNLLVTKDFQVKIADFGLSRQIAPGKMQTYCGTPANMAPEMVLQHDYNEKADVFSFGIILWELLTREEPYAGAGGLSLAYAVAVQGLRPPIPAYCPAEWALMMVQCWDAEKASRPSFDELQRALAWVIRIFDAALHATPGAGSMPSSLDFSMRGSMILPDTAGDITSGTRGKPAPWVSTKDVLIMGRGVADIPAVSHTAGDQGRPPLHPTQPKTALGFLQHNKQPTTARPRLLVEEDASRAPLDGSIMTLSP